jgi:hypothetical protein
LGIDLKVLQLKALQLKQVSLIIRASESVPGLLQYHPQQIKLISLILVGVQDSVRPFMVGGWVRRDDEVRYKGEGRMTSDRGEKRKERN